MYTVTFYSYKGGVGRTMALVNTAVSLAELGHRVLVVDFDLEAPGLPSYQIFQDTKYDKGIVDYVTSYRADGVAPDVAEFVVKCANTDKPIWLMPAGRYTESDYAGELNSIDWQELYENQNGYLFFEDLKQQWAQYDGIGFDYVLIDSRTGHTDVGGICTRQIPDAVVVMFLPNEQNIIGLEPIVQSIRDENKTRSEKITLHFCPSNVPDLDDEKGILSKLLDAAKEKLKYEDDFASFIHHYGSLDILAQSAFAISRPNSKLSKEYETLRKNIVAKNFTDREGAIVALQRMPTILGRARSRQKIKTTNQLQSDAIDIRNAHQHDGEIAFLAVPIFHRLVDKAEELSALNTAIDANYEIDRAHLSRAFFHSASEQREEALNDFRRVVSSPTSTVFELMPALRSLKDIDDDWLGSLKTALRTHDKDFATIQQLSRYYMTFRDGMEILCPHISQCSKSKALNEDEKQSARSSAILSSISIKNYSNAKSLIGIADSSQVQAASAIDIFNYAITNWGETGTPTKSLFEALVNHTDLKDRKPDVNTRQCLALSYAVTGDTENARIEIDAALKYLKSGELAFSCWRYLNVSGDDMAEDLMAMKSLLDADKPLVPVFIDEEAGLSTAE